MRVSDHSHEVVVNSRLLCQLRPTQAVPSTRRFAFRYVSHTLRLVVENNEISLGILESESLLIGCKCVAGGGTQSNIGRLSFLESQLLVAR